MIKILVIGCGPHATHFYLPSLCKLSQKDSNIKIAGVLDLLPQKDFIMEELALRSIDVDTWFIHPFSGDKLSAEAEELLDRLVLDGTVNAVIISTDPLNHKSYALWALSRGLPILMDKPVTTSENAALDIKQAEKIQTDYEDLLKAYQKYASSSCTPFVLCAHRRYHPGILEVRNIIREVAIQTSCPVTNIRSMHADGQWRLPHEICTQQHHSYNQGYGKISHSGFHFIDCVVEFWKEGFCSGKKADEISIYSSFLRPHGLLQQITLEDYEHIFGKEFRQVCTISEQDMRNTFERCGEVDAEINLELLSDKKTFSLASLSLIHNSYSQRSWLLPDRDLYKGNGRIKHEEHTINIGPFLNIQVHSYQSKDKHSVCTTDDEAPGGNNHFEIFIFRNDRIIGGKKFEKIQLHDLPAARTFSSDSLFIQQIKERSIIEWIEAILSPKKESEMFSAFTDHSMSVALMSGIYRSYCKKQAGMHPVETISWRDE